MTKIRQPSKLIPLSEILDKETVAYKKAIESIRKCGKTMQDLKIPAEKASKALNDYYNAVGNKDTYD